MRNLWTAPLDPRAIAPMYTVLRNWLTTTVPADALHANDLVLGADAQWRPATAYAELAPLFPAPAPPKSTDWEKIALAALALGAGAWLVKQALEDPEPRRIRQIAESYEREGAIVSADIRGWPRPPSLNGRRPDVFAEFLDGWCEAVEVENDRSIDRSHARGQIADLAEWEARSPLGAFFVEVVRGGRGGKG